MTKAFTIDQKTTGLMDKTLVSLVTKKFRFESVRSLTVEVNRPKRTPALT